MAIKDFNTLQRSINENGIALNELLLAAGVCKETWLLGKSGRCAPRDATLRKLNEAFDRLKINAPARRPPAAIAALVNGCEEILRARMAGDVALIQACSPKPNARHVPAGRLRWMAIYLIAVELEIGTGELRAAIGCSRENVRKARECVESLRDNDRVDALLTTTGDVLRGQRAA